MFNVPVITVNNLDNIVYRGEPYILDFEVVGPTLVSQITEQVSFDSQSGLGLEGFISEFPIDKREWYFDINDNVEISKFELPIGEPGTRNLLVTGRKPIEYECLVLFNGVQIQTFTDLTDVSNHRINITSSLFKDFIDGVITIQINYREHTLERNYDLILVNTAPMIMIGDVVNNKIDVSIIDDEDDLVKINIKINGKDYHPADGGFTDYLNSPYFYSTHVTGDLLIVDDKDFTTPNNIVTVTVIDRYGAKSQLHKAFIGEYVGLLFVDEDGGFYSDDSNNYTDDANIIREQYLGELRAGTRGDKKTTYLYNKTPFKMSNMQLNLNTVGIAEGTDIRIARDSTTGFNEMSQNKLDLGSIELNAGERMPFYIQANTNILSLGGGYYYIDVIADPVE